MLTLQPEKGDYKSLTPNPLPSAKFLTLGNKKTGFPITLA